MAKVEASVCLQCPEAHKRLVYARGLCQRCYNHARVHIHDGKTSWEELERQGLARPSTASGNAWRRGWKIGNQGRQRG
jgi:hypothetical protein